MTAVNENKIVWQNRFKLILLWMIPFGLMLLASVIYNLVQSGHISVASKNQGYLIQPPVQLGELVLTTDKKTDNIWHFQFARVRG